MRKFSFILSLIMMISIFTSCSKSNVIYRPYSTPQKISNTDSSVVAANSKFSLEWDADYKSLVINDLRKNTKWGSMPFNELENTFGFVDLTSTLEISYIESQRSLEMQTDSNELLQQGGYISAKKIDNGIRLIYYFDSVEICVPIEYTIDEYGLCVNVLVDGIKENNNKIYSISVLPSFASSYNNKDSYIFVPSGSGAIMYTDEGEREFRTYEEPIYGEDQALQSVFKNTHNESIRLPVFGLKRNENSVIGIVTDGAECASIVAHAGDSSKGFSYVASKFYLRGYANSYVKTVDGLNSEVRKYTDDIIGLKRLTVKYIPVNESDNSYNGMAKVYRDYLLQTNCFIESDTTADIMLDILGGSNAKKLFCGIPYETLIPATTLNQAKNILNDILGNTNASIVANLKGFGNSGIDYGELCGGFEISNKLGNKESFSELKNWCKDENIILSYDIDTIYFNDSSNGYSVNFDTAKTANGVAIEKYGYSLVTHKQDSSRGKTNLISRNILNKKITDDVSGLIDDYKIDAVCLSTLSNVAYSDYADRLYYCKLNTEKDAIRMFNNVKKKAMLVSDSANAYAANVSDYIINSPTASSKYFSLDKDVPFYQIVYRGSKAISGQSINLASDPHTEFLKSISTGCSLMFTVCDKYNDEFITKNNSSFAQSEYKDISSTISEYFKISKPLYEKLNNSKIISFTIDENVSHTVFENGVNLYVNFNSEPRETKLGIVNGLNFIYGEVSQGENK